MKAIIDKTTGEVLYCSVIEVPDDKNQVVVEVTELPFKRPFYNFTTEEFYEGEELIITEEVPSEVPLWKIRTVLKVQQMEEAIEQSINQLEEPNKTAALYIWQYGTSIERQSPTIAFIQNIMNLDDNTVDQLFIEAQKLNL